MLQRTHLRLHRPDGAGIATPRLSKPSCNPREGMLGGRFIGPLPKSQKKENREIHRSCSLIFSWFILFSSAKEVHRPSELGRHPTWLMGWTARNITDGQSVGQGLSRGGFRVDAGKLQYSVTLTHEYTAAHIHPPLTHPGPLRKPLVRWKWRPAAAGVGEGGGRGGGLGDWGRGLRNRTEDAVTLCKARRAAVGHRRTANPALWRGCPKHPPNPRQCECCQGVGWS